MTQRDLVFDGPALSTADHERLGTQLAAVRGAMTSGRWLTLDEIRWDIEYVYGIKATTQSISARLRDLRKAKFGGHTVERKRVEGGLYTYRLVV
jgi:hypothetical protein